jgi:transposase
MKHELQSTWSGHGFPPDLRCRVPENRLLGLVLEAVSQAGADRAGREFRHGGEGFNFNQILATLGYAYLIGIYGSEDLAEQLQSEPGLKYLCAGAAPDATVFRHFRRLHRGPLGVVLLRVLARCAAEQVRENHNPTAMLELPSKPPASAPEPDLLLQCAVEAEARLARAVFADMVALDV